MKVEIIIDSSCDLPREYLLENHVKTISYKYEIDGVEYTDDFGKTLSHEGFYNLIKEGKMPRTSQINQYRYSQVFRDIIKEGKELIYICLSSGLSGSYNNAVMAKNEILEEFPNAKIAVIDSKGASLGEGLLGYYAIEMKKSEKTFEEIVSWLEENKNRLNYWFVVDDLNHLKRGGRISSTAATIGTLFSIKPILHVNIDGELKNVDKVKGRKKSLKVLKDKLIERIENPENQVIGIAHSDDLEGALYLKDLVSSEIKVKDFIISNIGSTIGTHVGNGTVTLFFLGKEKNL